MRAQGVEDVLDGGAGENLLSGGILSDRFIFRQEEAGRHVVTDLEAWDVLRFEGFGYRAPAEALTHMTVQGTHVVFADQGVKVTFHDTPLAMLTQQMFEG